ncbi:MAG: hypothetical protein ABIH66_09630 [bacterium]
MGNLNDKKSQKVRRDLLGISMLFFSISFATMAYAILDLKLGVSLRLADRFSGDIGVLSDAVFVVAVPIFLSVLILQAFVLYRILKRLVESKRDGGRAIRTPFGRAIIENPTPVNVVCRDPEERGLVVTVR